MGKKFTPAIQVIPLHVTCRATGVEPRLYGCDCMQVESHTEVFMQLFDGRVDMKATTEDTLTKNPNRQGTTRLVKGLCIMDDRFTRPRYRWES